MRGKQHLKVNNWPQINSNEVEANLRKQPVCQLIRIGSNQCTHLHGRPCDRPSKKKRKKKSHDTQFTSHYSSGWGLIPAHFIGTTCQQERHEMTRLPTRAAVVVSARGRRKKKKVAPFPTSTPLGRPSAEWISRGVGGEEGGGGSLWRAHRRASGEKETKERREGAPLMS